MEKCSLEFLYTISTSNYYLYSDSISVNKYHLFSVSMLLETIFHPEPPYLTTLHQVSLTCYSVHLVMQRPIFHRALLVLLSRDLFSFSVLLPVTYSVYLNGTGPTICIDTIHIKPYQMLAQHEPVL